MKKYALGILVSIGFVLSVNTAFAAAQPTSLEGTISIEYEDFESHSQLRYWLTDGENSRKELALQKAPGWLKSGQRVRVSGSPQGKKFQVEDNAVTLLLSSDGSSNTDTTGTTLVSNAVTGERSVLVAIVDFEEALNESMTVSKAEDLVFSRVSSYFQEASYGLTSLNGDVISDITLPLDPLICDTYEVSQQADQLIRDLGYEPDQYDHVMYIIPTNYGCKWSGQGTVGGTGTARTWIKAPFVDVVSHELGHNFGLHHSHSYHCDGATIPDAQNSCTYYEYGDYAGRMGNASIDNHFNGFNKEQLGWLDARVETVTNSKTVKLSPFELENPTYPQVLKVFKGLDVEGNSEWYYLEYRQQIGYDTNLISKYPLYQYGLLLRMATEDQPKSSYLLDSTPESDWSDITINPGNPYRDTKNGLEINVLSANGSEVEVEVIYTDENNTAKCQQGPMDFSSTSVTSVTAQAGDTVTFTYLLSNNDSSECSAETFNISTQMGSELSGQVDISQVTLNPGENQAVTLFATIATETLDGTYLIPSTVNRESTGESVSQTATVYVSGDSAQNQPPVAVNDSAVLESIASINIAPLINDYDPEGDTLTIISVSQGEKGEVVLNNDNTITYLPLKRFKSSDQFSYTVSDGQLSSTATINVQLTGNQSDTSQPGQGNGRK